MKSLIDGIVQFSSAIVYILFTEGRLGTRL